jgi:hypothetical protein
VDLRPRADSLRRPARATRLPRSAAAVLGLALGAGPPVLASPPLEVSGEVVSVVPRLEVRVVVTNRGNQPTGPLDVAGELLGERREARVSAGVEASASAAVVLGFDASPKRPGLHALTLLLEHPVEGPPDAGGNPPVESERAWLLLALGPGPPPEPAVRLEPEPAPIDVRGELRVRLRSADGAPHRVSLRGLAARGLRFEGPPVEVTVPGSSSVLASLPMVRAGAPRGTKAGVLVVAETADGPLARTAVAGTNVEVAPDPSVLPRVRWVVLVAGVALLAAAAVAEWRRAYPR